MTDRAHPHGLPRSFFSILTLLLTLAAVLSAPPAQAEDVSPPAPPVVDTPPPPPVPATVDISEIKARSAQIHEALEAQAQAAQAQAAAEAQAAQTQEAQAQPVYQYGDPYGFTGWLNGVRAQYGLGAVGFDPNLAGWAAANNGQQQARGMGHHVMGPARRQNSGMGGAMSTVAAMWMASPAHQAALLDPSITMIGIAASGAYWTYNAY